MQPAPMSTEDRPSILLVDDDETFRGRLTLFSDQYSLAITYQELLTGTLPFTGKN